MLEISWMAENLILFSTDEKRVDFDRRGTVPFLCATLRRKYTDTVKTYAHWSLTVRCSVCTNTEVKCVCTAVTRYKTTVFTRVHKTLLRFMPMYLKWNTKSASCHKHLMVWFPPAPPLPQKQLFSWVESSSSSSPLLNEVTEVQWLLYVPPVLT